MAAVDGTKLGEAFAAYGPALLLYARSLLQRGGAEDVVQEAFVRLMQQSQWPVNLKAWLFVTVRHLAIDVTRSTRRRRERERKASGAELRWFQADELIDAAAAQHALDQLPAVEREVIVLRIWGGLTLAETAQTMGAAVSSVHDRYRTGLKALQRLMELPCKNKTI